MIQNLRGIRSIYLFEMARFGRTFWTSLMLPVITTTLYFVVFGSAIGSRMSDVSTVPYGAFIVPGLMMLTMFTESISNASFGIYMPKWTGTIYEMLSSPMSPLELLIAYVGAAATKSVIIGAIIFATAHLFVDVQIAHPVLMVLFMILMAVTFCLFGFIIGIWAQSFEQLQVIPLLVVYLISGFRWTFFGQGDVGIGVSMGAVALFLTLCLAVIFWMFRTGYRLKN